MTSLTDTDWGPQESRTVSWHDPAKPAEVGLAMPGIDYLRAMVAGDMPPPPIAQLLQFDLVEADPGRVVFTCTPDASAYNPIGAVHGGLVCTLLDSVAGCALHSTLPAGKGYTSVEIKVNYLKAVRLASGTLTAKPIPPTRPRGASRREACSASASPRSWVRRHPGRG